MQKNRNSQTTSTKCQYQAAASKPKCCLGEKPPFISRIRQARMREQWAGLTRRAGEALDVATQTTPARVGETLEPALRLLGTLGVALFAVWGLRRLEDLVDALGELVQG